MFCSTMQLVCVNALTYPATLSRPDVNIAVIHKYNSSISYVFVFTGGVHFRWGNNGAFSTSLEWNGVNGEKPETQQEIQRKTVSSKTI